MMFTAHCPACQKRSLVFPSQVSRWGKDSDGSLTARYNCWCGKDQTHFFATVKHPLAA
ncbi:hypothetical protein GCM10027425_22020 [Alteromonas gracilis]